MPFVRARIGGSGFTTFLWQGQLIGFARMVQHTSPTPVGTGQTPIHPMDTPYATEIITPQAANPGTIVLELYELFGEPVWQRLADVAGSVDIVDIFAHVANSSKPITMVKVVNPPALQRVRIPPYHEEYHNCVITAVEDGERIEVGTLEVLKHITVMYTHMTREGRGFVPQ